MATKAQLEYWERLKGRKLSEEHKKKIRENCKGINKSESSGNWKGNDAKYCSKHIFIYGLKGKAIKCEQCGIEGKSRYEWSNIDHKYSRNPDDYRQLCCKCHSKYDVDTLGIKKGRNRKII